MRKIIIMTLLVMTLLVSFINHANAMNKYDECIDRFASVFHESESDKLVALCMAYAKQEAK